MIISMTGFAAAAAELPGVSLSVELRSVNHRFLDVSLRLPDEIRTIEPQVREALAAALRRGKVDCRVALNRAQAGASGLAVDADQVRRLAAAAAAVASLVPGASPITVHEVLRWPGVLAEPTVDPAELASRTLALVGEALRDLAAARQREGNKTAAVLEQCCAGISLSTPEPLVIVDVRARLPTSFANSASTSRIRGR
ncbi:MAG: YicC/YloC family endoribonuclease [Burkholderiales bacterium]